MSTDAGNPPLIVKDASKFTQNGSWSMLDFIKLPIEVTVGMASRYMAALVNPYTVVVGQALARPFQLSPSGYKNVGEAMKSLKVVRTLGKTLEIGFGIDDIVYSMAQFPDGATCLALCAALQETYSQDVAIEVLLELARDSKVNGQWMPSYSEWASLLEACSGVLSTSQFSLRAEILMSLQGGDEQLGAFNRSNAITKPARGCSNPQSIAKALAALSKISRKELKAITIVGHSDTGWSAAIAEWLLRLEVVIKNSQGDVLYASRSNTCDIAVTIIYQEDKAQPSQEIQLSGQTYIMEDISDLFNDGGVSNTARFVSGRLGVQLKQWRQQL
ncbi:MAG: hypothetical protein Q9160_004048 [Pyrenula sp. 1 TL-2023]